MSLSQNTRDSAEPSLSDNNSNLEPVSIQIKETNILQFQESETLDNEIHSSFSLNENGIPITATGTADTTDIADTIVTTDVTDTIAVKFTQEQEILNSNPNTDTSLNENSISPDTTLDNNFYRSTLLKEDKENEVPNKTDTTIVEIIRESEIIDNNPSTTTSLNENQISLNTTSPLLKKNEIPNTTIVEITDNAAKTEEVAETTDRAVTKNLTRSHSSGLDYQLYQHSMSHSEYASSPNYRDETDGSQGLITPTKFCKICQETELFEQEKNGKLVYTKGKLISPCKCKGSLKYVHIDCLNQWRTTDVRPDATYQCEVCKYNYKIYRPKLAKIVGSKIFLHFISIIFFLITIYTISWFVKVIDTYAINKDRSDPSGWRYNKILGVEFIYLIIGLCIISLLGTIFMLISSCCIGPQSTRDNYCYCGGCECISCYGCLMFGDCGGGAGDCGVFIVLVALFAGILLFIVGILCALTTGYLLIQKLSNIYLDQVKEKILEVVKE